MSGCVMCPRKCGADRERGETGYCGADGVMRVSRAAPHFFEEPPISGERGSGTVFFSGCSLKCVFCQNRDISRNGRAGEAVDEERLCELMLGLCDMGVHNINLVTATHHTEAVASAIERVKDKLSVPVVWNSSGYERPEVLKRLEGLVDIYLPDLKYRSSELSGAYSSAPDYYDRAIEAIAEMYRQTGGYRYSEDGMLAGGVVVRHLVLPGARKDSIEVLRGLAAAVDPKKILLSLMSQYTPDFALDSGYDVLKRRITSFEYRSVLDEAERLGFDGFSQAPSSARKDYTPDFKI